MDGARVSICLSVDPRVHERPAGGQRQDVLMELRGQVAGEADAAVTVLHIFVLVPGHEARVLKLR